MISQKEIEDKEGNTALIYGVAEDESSLIARLSDDQLLSVPIRLLIPKDENRYFLSLRFSELQEGKPVTRTIPVIEEVPVVSKKTVETGRVKIRKSVQESTKVIQQALAREEVIIDRVDINEVREEPAQSRIEGDVTVIPVQEEILVVQKKVLVREEIRVRKVKTEHEEKIEVNLKKEEISIDRKKLN